MLLEERYDPMGHAIRDYYERRPVRRLRVLSSLFDEDEMPVGHLFRSVDDMNLLERTALGLCHGRVLDVGAGAGCHSLALQERGLAVTAVDVSPLSVGVMRRRGVRDARLADFFADDLGGPFDTVLLLMNGIGLCGRLEGLPRFFARLGALLAPGGAVLADSSDLRSCRRLLRRGGLPHEVRRRKGPALRLALCRFRHSGGGRRPCRLQGRTPARGRPLRLSGAHQPPLASFPRFGL